MKSVFILFVFLGISVLSLLGGPTIEENTAAGTFQFKGRVTAVNSNGNRPGLSFTAVNDQGQVRMFYISTLEHLELQDRVELTCKASEKFPLEVIRIRFLSPKSSE